jgi:hypothetical protein
MRRYLSIFAACAVGSSAAFAQTISLDAADRFAFGGPADGSYRLYDRATGKLVAKTDALVAEVYALPEKGQPNAYVVLAEGWEDDWAFSVRRVNGREIADLFRVPDADRLFDAHDLNADEQLDFTFYRSAGDDIDTEFGLVALRDYVSGPSGYSEQTPPCGSPRNTLARQRLAHAIERNKRRSRPDAKASTFFSDEVLRLSQGCQAK